jgi:hypothetical protein
MEMRVRVRSSVGIIVRGCIIIGVIVIGGSRGVIVIIELPWDGDRFQGRQSIVIASLLAGHRRHRDPVFLHHHHILSVTVHHTFTINIHRPVRPPADEYVEPKGEETERWAIAIVGNIIREGISLGRNGTSTGTWIDASCRTGSSLTLGLTILSGSGKSRFRSRRYINIKSRSRFSSYERRMSVIINIHITAGNLTNDRKGKHRWR